MGFIPSLASVFHSGEGHRQFFIYQMNEKTIYPDISVVCINQDILQTGAAYVT